MNVFDEVDARAAVIGHFHRFIQIFDDFEVIRKVNAFRVVQIPPSPMRHSTGSILIGILMILAVTACLLLL